MGQAFAGEPFSWRLVGQLRRLHVGQGEHLVDVVDQLGEGRGFAVAGVGKGDLEVGADLAGIAP